MDADTLEPFCQLADPASYVACAWDLAADHEAREHWVTFFKKHVHNLLRPGAEAEKNRGVPEAETLTRVDACVEAFNQKFDAFFDTPSAFPGTSILTLDMWRDGILREHGFADPLVDLKARENDAALPLLPQACATLDALQASPDDFNRDVLLSAVQGVFAGNIFDLGAPATAQKYMNEQVDFAAVRKSLKPRPWRIDHFEAFAERAQRKWKKLVFFVDNAGGDVILGALPMMRLLARAGTQVVLAANELPVLNDITHAEVTALWPRVLELEPSFGELPFELVSTGTAEPLIDLLGVSPALNRAAADADLVILEGMGRGIESNIDVTMSCDVMNIGLVKDVMVAKRVGGEVYDCICRFVPAM